MRDGVELSANIWRPLPGPGDPVDARFPAILEMIPYGKDNWRRNVDVGRGEYFARRGYALCRLDVRGTGSSGGVALDEYHEEETRDGYDAVEWLATRRVVRRQRRDVGHQLRRVHLDPGGEASPAAPARDRPGHGHRRPLHDRRALRGRVRHRERAQPVRREPGRDERDAARRRVPRRGLARGMAGAARGDAAVAVRMAAPSARRPVLATGLPRPRLRGDQCPDPEHRRLDGLVCRCGAADAGAVQRALADDRRQLGPRAAGGGDTRSEPRRAPRDGPLLRSLAAGQRRRGSRGRTARSASDLVRTGLRTARAVPGSVAGSLAIRRGIPPPVGRTAIVGVRRRVAAAGRAARRARPPPSRSWSATGTGRRRAPAARCRGAPAAHPTAWPATCARTRPSDRPSPRRRSTNRCRSSASRRSCSTWPCRPRSRPPSCVLPTSHPTGHRRR